MSDEQDQSGDLWLFGYGSLIWKPPPYYDLRVPGYIEGYVRRFWQASQDHRGTPEAPGRVVTLIEREVWEKLTDQHPTAPPKVWGAAYRIPASHVAAAKHLLDIREINGYTVHTTPFHQADMTVTYQTVHTSSSTATTNPSSASKVVVPDKIQCLLYIGLPTNPQFVGPQDPQALAEHIMRSRGPSGENREYLYQLGEALEGLSDESGDEHVRDLIRRCREIEARERG